jgi:hypothetical protein
LAQFIEVASEWLHLYWGWIAVALLASMPIWNKGTDASGFLCAAVVFTCLNAILFGITALAGQILSTSSSFLLVESNLFSRYLPFCYGCWLAFFIAKLRSILRRMTGN